MAEPFKPKSSKSLLAMALAVLVAVVGAYLKQQQGESSAPPTSVPRASDRSVDSSAASADLAPLLQAIRNRSSGTHVQAAGEIAKMLPDDNDGSRHQRFIVRLATGDTILIAHNIDLARRVVAREGDRVEFKGEYIWNDRGGVVHWTHHDPAKRHAEGWIRVKGETFD
jgi:S1-C subfamily serine protease